jgi:ADP-heptose:LPS heptosyltransferase
MNKNIAILIPHKGVGDLIFHYNFINSIYKKYKKKILLFTSSTSKANLIYKNNKIFKKIVLLNLKRPKKIFYLLKILKLCKIFNKYNFELIYYTGNNNWQKICFFLLKIFKKFKLVYYKNNYNFIIDFLESYLKKIKIKSLNNYNLIISTKVNKIFKKKIKKNKKPWVFLSIDTSEDQINIPKELMYLLINKLKKKYKTIFVNTNFENKSKFNNLNHLKFIPTFKHSILEINYIIKHSDLFIGNDSGPANLAVLLEKKSIVFLSKKTRGDILKMPHKKTKFFKIEEVNNKYKKILNAI